MKHGVETETLWKQRFRAGRSKLHNSLGLLRETLDFLIVHDWESEQI